MRCLVAWFGNIMTPDHFTQTSNHFALCLGANWANDDVCVFFCSELLLKCSEQRIATNACGLPNCLLVNVLWFFHKKSQIHGLTFLLYHLLHESKISKLGGGNSNIFYFHPYLGKSSNFDEHIFQMGWSQKTWDFQFDQTNQNGDPFSHNHVSVEN